MTHTMPQSVKLNCLAKFFHFVSLRKMKTKKGGKFKKYIKGIYQGSALTQQNICQTPILKHPFKIKINKS